MPRYQYEVQSMGFVDSVSDAFGEFQCLVEDLGEVREALEDRLSHTARYQTIDDTLNTLENYTDEPSTSAELEKFLGDTKINVGIMRFTRKKSRSGPSRQNRFDNAVAAITAAAEHLTDIIDNAEDAEEKLSDDLLADIEEYRDELQEVVDNVGGCEFPGMMG